MPDVGISNDNTIIAKGQRAAIWGRAGVGKTTLGKWAMFRSPMQWVVLDTKYDDGFNGYRTANKLPAMSKIGQVLRDEKLYVIRPTNAEISDPRRLDSWLGEFHESWNNTGIFIDEGYQVCLGSNAGPGLTGLLTRGRQRGQSVIVGSQRPARLPLFCFTEANHYFIMQLSSRDDKKKIADYTGRKEIVDKQIEPFHFLHFDVAKGKLTPYSPVRIT
jgi:hypothetical protein